jgi:hypothetical protein
MIDLTTIPDETLIARGQYSTVRAEHEDAKKRLAILCGSFSSIAPQVLRLMQPDGDAAPDIAQVNDLIASARVTLDKIDACVASIEGLAQQRAALKQAAWGRP